MTARAARRVTVTTAATSLSFGADRFVALRNLDASAAVYIGPSDVTYLTGFPVYAGETYDESTYKPSVPITVGDSQIYAITQTGSVSVAVMEV